MKDEIKQLKYEIYLIDIEIKERKKLIKMKHELIKQLEGYKTLEKRITK